jgi:hypothetical protein
LVISAQWGKKRFWIAGVLLIIADLLPRHSAESATGLIPELVGIDLPGVVAGETADWTVTGRGLAGLDRLLISGSGVEVVAIGAITAGSIEVRVKAMPDAPLGFRELRAVGPSGVSNLLVFRVDHLRQSRESEPNDDPAAANPLPMNQAVAGILAPQDLDYFAFTAREGDPITIEVEAWRLGSPIVPVVTLFAPSGASLAQSRPLREDGHDCRLSYQAPADGRILVQVRDALYRGGATARYRLRIETGPYATGLYPLGGRRGETIEVRATGGNLTQPWHKAVLLPDEPGTIVDVGMIAGPGGSLLAPARLIVGDGPEIHESPGGLDPTRLPSGATANGRIDRPGEVDRYAVAVHAGEPIRVAVEAAALGSWLDSVVTLDDRQGNRLAEGDDRGRPAAVGARDSRLEFVARADQELIVAISDRFGDGGPEYAYRLSVGPPRADFAVTLRLAGDASAAQPAGSGALNLTAGTTVPIRFEVTAEGRPGPIQVRAEGLPPGVIAEPVLVRLPRVPRGQGTAEGTAAEGTLVLKVEPGAGPALGSMRIKATARNADGSMLTRQASAALVLNPMPADDPRPPPSRVVGEFPVLIVGPQPR